MPSLDVVRSAYAAQAEALVTWLVTVPADAWSRPSRLPAWTVGELAFHTTEVPQALTNAIAAAHVTDKPLSIAAYTAIWRTTAPQIADRARDGSVGLMPADVAARHAEATAAMFAAIEGAGGDPVLAARRGPIRLSDFLLTRVNEVVVHSLDLSSAVPELDPVTIDRQALGIACRMLTGVLAENAPGHTVEVRVPPFAAVQCVEGPRHTRGTPPNVVEVDAVTWIELATGRLDWSAAVANGRVRASGERADISDLLPVLA
jgi:uncharacterized protein (TIGR03083 family)